tara:strand:+ start:4806 stop:5390 length:585 start_codon:yes stop_codon:yes gene_type:complete
MKIPKNAQRAYAIASFIGTTLKCYDTEDTDLHKLELQCKKAMKVFSIKAGTDETMALADRLVAVWQDLQDNYSYTIDEDSLPALIEGISMIVSPKDFKDFFGVVPFYKAQHQYYVDYPNIMRSVNGMNSSLNNLLGTQSVRMVKPKVVVPKVKKPKPKSKAQKAHEKRVEEARMRAINVKSFLRDRIAKAKGEK